LQTCTHLDQIRDMEPSAQGCEECLQTGDTWVHLRECLSCGHVGCCDSSVALRGRNAVLFRAALSPAGDSSYEVALA
jgi:ubiquitin-hydrolase Zn-finger-containing protein